MTTTPTLVRDDARDAEAAVRTLLRHIGEDPDREGLKDTPARVVRALRELTAGRTEDAAEILATVFDEPATGPVVVRDIPFASLCEHHLLPFEGHATVAYLPGERIVGLSKLARLVHAHARRLQVQERMTADIAEDIMTHLNAKGAAVIVRAQHTCMRIRGARSPGEMVTSSYLGDLRDPDHRRDILDAAR